MANEFKVGDVVYLMTGGPDMVVVSIRRTPRGAVLVGCAPLEGLEMRRFEAPAIQFAMMN